MEISRWSRASYYSIHTKSGEELLALLQGGENQVHIQVHNESSTKRVCAFSSLPLRAFFLFPLRACPALRHTSSNLSLHTINGKLVEGELDPDFSVLFFLPGLHLLLYRQ